MYKIERLWPGKTCAILTCGPSTADHNLDCLSAVYVIAINDAWKLYPTADVLFSGDWRFFRDNPDLSGYKGPQIACVSSKAFPAIQDARKVHIGRGPRRGLTDDRTKVAGQHTCVSQAVNFAYHRGCTRIVLIGVDLHPGEHGERYAFQNRKAEKEELDTYDKMRENIRHLTTACRQKGIELKHAGLRSYASYIPMYETLEQALFV